MSRCVYVRPTMLKEPNKPKPGDRPAESAETTEHALLVGAEALAALGQYGAARLQMEAALRANPESTRARALAATISDAQVAPMLGEAAAHFLADRLEEAAALLRQVIAIEPEHEQAQRMLAAVDRRLEDRLPDATGAPRLAPTVISQRTDTAIGVTRRPAVEEGATAAIEETVVTPFESSRSAEPTALERSRGAEVVASQRSRTSRSTRWLWVTGGVALAAALLLWARVEPDRRDPVEDDVAPSAASSAQPPLAGHTSVAEGPTTPAAPQTETSELTLPALEPPANVRPQSAPPVAQPQRSEAPQVEPSTPAPAVDAEPTRTDAAPTAAIEPPRESSNERSPRRDPTPPAAVDPTPQPVATVIATARAGLRAGDWETAIEAATRAAELATGSAAAEELSLEILRAATAAARRARDDATGAGATAESTRFFSDAAGLEELGGKRAGESALVAARSYYVAADLFQRSREQAQLRGMRRALDAYAAAHASTSLDALRAVWPGLSGQRLQALTRSFQEAKTVQTSIDGCSMSLGGSDRGVAVCDVNQTYIPHRGLKQSSTARMRFELRQNGSAWRIDHVKPAGR